MAYSAPTITSTGLSIPTYQEILEELINEMKAIYGQDIYLGNDSQDYQMLSIFSLKIYDIMQLLQMVYNNRGPSTATGSGLDSIIKLNGITRKSGIHSTCPVVLTGTPQTQIRNGVVEDITGYSWSLPDTVTIENTGEVTVTATCQVLGPIVSSIGDINKIVTPTLGWDSVANIEAATVGQNVEKDSEVRARQAISVASPSLSVLETLKSSLSTIKNVTQSRIYENDTSETDNNGLPSNSITAVVDGGSDLDVANILFKKKSPGVFTNGTTAVDVIDAFGETNTIRFYRSSPVDSDVVVNVKKLSGYTDQITADIKSRIANLLNSYKIGDDVSVSSLWGAALSAMNSLSNPAFSITSLTAARHGGPQGTDDIVMAFNEVARGNADYISVNVS